MYEWYRNISNNPSNYTDHLVQALSYFDTELASAKEEVKINGNLEILNRQLPGIVEHRYSQLQELEAILEFMNIQLNKLKTAKFRKYLEGYNRALSSRDADRYADGDDEVISMMMIVNEVALIRNGYLAIMKGIEQKSFAVSNITRLRAAGLDDATLR